MAEEVELVEDRPVNGETQRDKERGRDTPSTGFTAVNGDEPRNTSFRPDDSQRNNRANAQPRPEPDRAQRRERSPTWNSDELSTAQARKDLPHPGSTQKRKRTNSTEAASPGGTNSEATSRGEKRRTETIDRIETNDSGIGRETNESATRNQIPPRHPPSERPRYESQAYAQSNQARISHESPEHGRPARYSDFDRERSPGHTVDITRWPSPSERHGPRTEAQIAESLQQELHGMDHRPDETLSGSPQEDSFFNDGTQDYSPEQTQQTEGSSDPKKRKRIFSNRTKTGCHTCRRRKKKCDESKPHCSNCARGGFTCEGYGVKPPPQKDLTPGQKAPIPLQAKQHVYPGSHFFSPPTAHPPPPPEYAPGPRYDHWGRVPPPPEPSSHYDAGLTNPHHPNHPDNWRRPVWPGSTNEQASYLSDQLPPTDFSRIPPLHDLNREPSHDWASRPSTSIPPRYQAGPPSIASTNSQRTAQQALQYPSLGSWAGSEKEKMLIGEPFNHFIDSDLMLDRQECKSALERYNEAARPSTGVSSAERARLFRAIVEPAARQSQRNNSPTDPIGSVGHRTIVESPFSCDYGYNIHIGDDVVIQAGCYFQDCCRITIGHRVLVGPNVRFYGMTASSHSDLRKGSQGPVIGGAIVIEDDVFIGGDVIIMPFRTIKKGSVVGAGSIVTKDVNPNTVVAGNPIRLIRMLSPTSETDRHTHQIQKQNETMLAQMRKDRERDTERARNVGMDRPLMGR